MNRNYVTFLIGAFLVIVVSQFFIVPPEDDKLSSQTKDDRAITQEKVDEEFSVEEESYALPEENILDEERLSYERYVSFSTPLYEGKISTIGGKILDVNLKTYFEDPESNFFVKLLQKREFLSNTIIKAKDVEIPKDIKFVPNTNNIVVSSREKSISLISKIGDIKLEKNYLFKPDSHGIEQRIIVTNNSNTNLKFRVFEESIGLIKQKEYSLFNYYVDDEMESVDSNPSEAEKIIGGINWYGFAKKYFLAFNIINLEGDKTLKYGKSSKNYMRSVLSYRGINLKPGSQYTISSTIFLGPKDRGILKKFGNNFEKAQDLGWVEWLAVPLEQLLKFSNKFINNYGLSIIFITILIRLLFLPLTVKSMMSMKKMQAKMAIIKPQIDAIKEKYKDDKTTQNSETMKVYSKEGMNPLSSLSGCLPMLIQLPVFVALYYVLLYSIDLRHTAFLWMSDLSSPENLFDIPGIGIPFRVLPLLMGASWFLTQKLTPPNPGADEFQTKMFQYMPIIFTVMFWGLPSGLILYWTVSNVISIFQQLYINNKFNKMQGA